MDIRDKVVAITGASAGIGRAAALACADAGARLVLAARSGGQLEALAAEISAAHPGGAKPLVAPTDMRRPDEVKRLIKAAADRFGRIDVLVNNAGQGMAGLTENADLEAFRSILELNVFGPVRAMQAAIPVMRANGGGLVLNVSSMVSQMNIPGLGFYASTKSALNMLSATARGELERDNIRVVIVFPRATATDFGRNSAGDRELRSRQRAGAGSTYAVDPPEHVAAKILEAIKNEPAEQYMDR
jgi:short-subunit dehydrogenase